MTDPVDRFYELWEAVLATEDSAVPSMEPAHRAVFLVGLLEAEVMNGGLGQYLTNTEGVHVEATLDTLETIAAPRTRDLLARAVALADGAESYVAAWDDRSSEYSELDDEFMSTGENLPGLTMAAFGEPGSA